MLGKTLVFGTRVVKIGFRALGADTQRIAGLFQRGEAGAGCGGELVECSLVVGADADDLVDCGGLGVVGADDGRGLGLAGSGGVLLGLLRSCSGVRDLAGGVGAGGADVMLRGGTGLLDWGDPDKPHPARLPVTGAESVDWWDYHQI